MPFLERSMAGMIGQGSHGRSVRFFGTTATRHRLLRLYSYVLDHDFGFAPNPFYGICTLATCKPKIRATAGVGDYIVGTGCAKHRRRGYIVYFMRVEEISDYDCYWDDPRFQRKKPTLRGSKMQEFGDNIYHRHQRTREWLQANSLHSLDDGSPNMRNVVHDTQCTKVLISRDYAYWGGTGPLILEEFRNFNGFDVCGGRGHKSRFPQELIAGFVAWLRGLGAQGFVGEPLDWVRTG